MKFPTELKLRLTKNLKTSDPKTGRIKSIHLIVWRNMKLVDKYAPDVLYTVYKVAQILYQSVARSTSIILQ